MMEKIKDALRQLDAGNDEHWTSDGLPRLDVLKELVGSAVSRADVSGAAKGFTRANPVVDDVVGELTEDGEHAEAPQTDPQATIDPQDDSTTDEEPIDEDAEAQARAELDEANEALHKAQARVNAATRTLDAIIVAKSKKVDPRKDAANAVKAFQQSQHKQRMANARQAQLVAQAMKEL